MALGTIALALLGVIADEDYAAYEARQYSKLGNGTTSGIQMKYITRFDRQNERELLKYISQPAVSRFVGSPVLCVGARLGGEVRAFQQLPSVSLAIGVDFNPGERNRHVMFGDAHDLRQFKNDTFGALYSNVLDHILHIDQFAREAHRVLAPHGALFVHLLHQSKEQVCVSAQAHRRPAAPRPAPTLPTAAHRTSGPCTT